jgi:hypothetical protein
MADPVKPTPTISDQLKAAIIIAAGQVAGGALSAATGGSADAANYMQQQVTKAFDEVLTAARPKKPIV